MNILELDSYNLADTVKFHDRLNPRLWDSDEHLLPEVKAKLLEVARDFQEFLGVPDLDVKDITISGSNAAFNYTPGSDIDLHIVVDVPAVAHDEVYRELFNAKKYQYNDEHDIRIRGADVELYAQDSAQPHHSQGIYSLLQDAWISVPKRNRAEIDDVSTRSKFEDLAARIDDAVKSQQVGRMDSLMKKIKTMRQTGLERQGEFGADNLAFKLLRNNGYIKKLLDAKKAARDQELSLAELARPKQKTRYGFGESPNGVDPTTKMFLEEPVAESPDGVNPTTAMFLTEVDTESVVQEFIEHTADRLGIERLPKVLIHHDSDWSESNHSFGMYVPERHELHVSLSNRHLMDVLRTAAHELCHCAQHESNPLPDHAGDTGSDWENEANAVAGVLMRDFARQHPEIFQADQIDEAGILSFFNPAQQPKKKWNPATDSRVVSNKKDDTAWVRLLIDKRKKGIELTDREWRSLQQWYADQGTPVAEGASGYIPTRAQAKDPRYSMALTVDIKPGQVGKEANKLGLKTNSQGKPALLIKSANLQESLAAEFALFEEQDLFEVKMTSKNLANLAKDIKGARVGLEFEMIVPNVANDENSDQEPDYDQDERVRDIDDAVNFFDDGDYNGRNEIRRLRERMESDYFDWQSEKIDERWYSDQGLEFFSEYLDREDPFDAEEAEEEARNELQAQYGDEISTEDFEKMLFAMVDEKRQNYAQEQWDEQGRNFDNAQEEFSDEQRDDTSESEWLSDQNIRFASDVESNYGDVTWPYYASNSDSESDIETVALDFMNAMGMDTVAISSSYHGSYKKWTGNGWVSIGSNKPDDCFTIEPDGSLEGDDSSDTGLEFVSPPIPLEDIGTVMSKVQNWAGNYGAYTGDQNKTSIHTNISIPDYDLDKLDYLKAALLLGDEYVLREFDRIGNTYAAPAIEKVRALVKQRPEKAQELLDKMKSQLNAEASKLIHSGQTNKFTSINTKDNRVEFRSPGGDYLSIIADNPQKMIDTINRMVVTLDAAMDPNKYKEEYQKKLYKMLTGQQSGREAESGAKREIKKDDKDLLNIFSRYAAGELPRAALKSFVRQAQLERKVNAGKDVGKMWWNVQWDNNRRIEVVATNKQEAKQVAAKEWGVSEGALAGVIITPLRPYVDPTYNKPTGNAETDSLQRELGLQAPQNVPTLNGRPSNPDGNWIIIDTQDPSTPVYRYMASDNTDAFNVLRQWIVANPGTQWNFKFDPTQLMGQPGQQTAQNQQGNWGIWITSSDRFVRMPGTGNPGIASLRRFPSQAAAMQFLETTREENPQMRSDIEIREIPADYQMPGTTAPVPGSTLDLQRQRAAAAQEPQGVDTSVDYELYNRFTGTVIDTFPARNDDEARVRLDDYRNLGAGAFNPEAFGVRRGPGVTNTASSQRSNATTQTPDQAQNGIIDVEPDVAQNFTPQTLTRPGQGQQVFTGEWQVVDSQGQELYRFGGVGNSQGDANRVAAQWAQRNQVSDEVSVVPVMGDAE